MRAITIPSQQTFVLWGKQEFLLKELRRLFGASVFAETHRLLGHDCLNSGFGGQSLQATHCYFWGGDQRIHRRGERPERRRDSFLFYYWPLRTQFWPKDHSSNDWVSNKQRKRGLAGWLLMTFLDTKTNSHAIQRKPLEGITDSNFLWDFYRKKRKTWCNYDQQGNQIIVFKLLLVLLVCPQPVSLPPFLFSFLIPQLKQQFLLSMKQQREGGKLGQTEKPS